MSKERILRGAGQLPDAMQGQWADVDEPGALLVIDGFDVSYQGRAVRHDFFTVSNADGALCVDLGIEAADDASLDSFASDNITNLVIDPDGDFHGYNVNFASQFERVGA